jgi:hypothetical protein
MAGEEWQRYDVGTLQSLMSPTVEIETEIIEPELA